MEELPLTHETKLCNTKTIEELTKKFLECDVSGHIEKKKNGNTELSYLSWAWAWNEVLKTDPTANYNIVKFIDEKGLTRCYMFDEDLGYMVFTNMTIGGKTHEMWLPVMDGANKAMKKTPYKYTTKFGEKTCEAASMFDVNKALMRCLVKNLAMFGLGLYIYAGEDLPENSNDDNKGDKCTPDQVARLRELGVIEENLCKHYKVAKLEELSFIQACEAIEIKEKQNIGMLKEEK